MSDKKITDMTALAAGSQATGDLLAVVDVSEAAAANKNKKMTMENLFKGIPGNVGIGTSAPAEQLSVISGVDNSSVDNGLSVYRSTGDDKLTLNCRGGAARFVADGGSAYIPTQFSRYNGTTFVDDLCISSAGFVGVGTTSPATKLEVHGSGVQIRCQVSSSKGVSLYGGTSSNTPAITYDDTLRFFDNDTGAGERLRIGGSGQIGLGGANYGTSGQVLTSNGASAAPSWQDAGGGLSSPLSANLDVGDYDIISSSNKNIDLTANGTGLIRVTENSLSQVPIVTQHDIGTAANEIPLNQHLGTAAFQDSSSFSVGDLTVTGGISGNLLVGLDASRNQNARIQSEANGYRVFEGFYHASDADGPMLHLTKSRGTGASPSSVSAGDRTGVILFSGHDGTDYEYCARIQAVIDGTPNTDDMPGRIEFSTTADGGTTLTERFRINTGGELQIRNSAGFYPITDNNLRLGDTSNRWQAVYAVNGTIQTSDEREKTLIQDSALGSDFIKSLRPVSYKWIKGGNVDTGERDEDSNYIYEAVPGQRTHWGFIAQEVKQAVDAAGVDFGGWLLTDKDDPESTQSLRYDQFIAPLTKALQEALIKIEALEIKVAALEGGD